MIYDDKTKIKKRIEKKNKSFQIISEVYDKIKPLRESSKILSKIEKQKNCSNEIEVYRNGVMLAKFCKQRTCQICNSIRMQHYANELQEDFKNVKYKRMIVLTFNDPKYYEPKKNSNGDYIIDKKIELNNSLTDLLENMFNFFHKSGLGRNKYYKKYNKEIKYVRTWEMTATNNKIHPHYHIIIGHNDDGILQTFGQIIIDYWIKWWENKSVNISRDAQYNEPLEKSILEGLHYALKMNSLKQLEPLILVNILRYLENKRLIQVKNVNRKLEKETDLIMMENKEMIIEALKFPAVSTFKYDPIYRTFINHSTGEIL